MKNIISCDYHGAEKEHEEAGIVNADVDLDQVVSVSYLPGQSTISFLIPKEENIYWKFLNTAIMSLEMIRIDDLHNSK